MLSRPYATRWRQCAGQNRNLLKTDMMEQLFKDIKYYLDLRVKGFKLSMIEHTSTTVAKILSYFVIILLAGIAVVLFSGALTVLIYQWLGSLLYAFLVMGCFVVIVALIIYLLRNKLFTGMLVGPLSKALFKEKYDDEDDYYED